MRKSAWLLSAGLFALSAPALAQQTDTDQGAAQPTDGATAEAGDVDASTNTVSEEPQQTGEIIVTATRRNEALSDVPLAVSAVTAQTLENTGASDIRQLTQVSPSLLVSSTSSEAGAGVARIRGVGTVGDNPGLESSVAVFIDGVYRSRTGVGLTELGQIDRIEVLRGPQGTLFGRNASAGLISIITAKPSFTTQINGELTIGNYDLRRLEVGATGALSSSLAARIDAIYMKRDGYLTDVISGRTVNDRDRYLLRGQLLYQPNDDFSVRLIADYAKRDEECCGAPFLRARDNALVGGNVQEQPSTIAGIERGLGAIISDDTFERDISITPGRNYASDVKDYGVSAEAVWDFGGAELTSITAYRYNDYVRGQDADFNNLDILYRDDDGNAANRFKTFSQELRLQGSAFGDKLDWLVGGYYANENLRVRDNLAYGADYSRFANCLVAANFAGAIGALNPAAGAALISTANPTCINPAIAAAVLPALQANPALAAQAPVLAAFARIPVTLPPALGGATINFGGPPFTSSGFTNLALAFAAQPLSLNGVGLDDEFRQTSNNFAVFTHNIFSITDRLKLTVGARYTRERKKLKATLTDNNAICRFFSGSPALASLATIPCVVPAVPGGSFTDSDSKTESKISGTVVLSYKPTDDLLTYASYSRGYKAGGYNLDRSALPRAGTGAVLPTARLDDLEFDPEINDSIELGMKYNGRGIDVNVAVFRQLFDDFQLNLFNGIAFEVENVNSCKGDLTVPNGDEDNSGLTGACTGKVRHGVRSQGVEFEIFTRPLRNVSFNLGGVYTDTRYRNRLVGSSGEPTSAQLFQLPGRRVSNSSEFTLTSSASWTPQIGNTGLRGLIYADMRHASTFNTGSDLDREKLQKGYTVVNGRIGISGPRQAWAVELWAQNIFKEDYLQVAFDAPLQGSGTVRGVERGFYPRSTQLFGAFLAEPRTYGLTFRVKFSPEPRMEAVAPPPPLPPEPVAPPPATQTCADGTVILATDACPAPPPPPPPPPPAPERG